MAASRALDVILLGPTGYTGKLCAEHVIQHLPLDLKWAIAGRSVGKLQVLRSNLRELSPSRLEPEILAANLEMSELDSLAKKTRVLINCIGPYHLYSTPIVEACVNNGTHYVDVTGETPWVRELIAKYHETAKSTGAISAPPDILSWKIVKCIQDNLSVGVWDMTIATHEMKASGASGGTLSTILNVIENYKLSDLAQANDPFCLEFNAQPKTKRIVKKSLAQTLFGARFVPGLGILTSSPSEMCDIATVYRSSTMMSEFYGQNFRTEMLVKVRSMFTCILIHVGFRISLLALLIPPVRWLVKKFIYAPGQGPTAEEGENDRVEYRGVAVADQPTSKPCRAFGTLSYENGPYPLSGLLLAEAAMVLLKSERIGRDNFGGFLTPAVLGQEFVDRLNGVGVSIEARILKVDS